MKLRFSVPAHGNAVSYPLAAVKIMVEWKEIIAHAAVAKSFPVAALLGWDVPKLMVLVKPTSDVETNDTIKAFVVATCHQKETQDASPCTTDSPAAMNEVTLEDVLCNSSGSLQTCPCR